MKKLLFIMGCLFMIIASSSCTADSPEDTTPAKTILKSSNPTQVIAITEDPLPPPRP